MKEQHKNPNQPEHSQPKWQPNPQQPTKEKERRDQQHQHQKKWPNNNDSQ